MQWVFWILLCAAAWTYVGYPLLLMALARVRTRPLVIEPLEPTVTVVISAFNEEKAIRRKLEPDPGRIRVLTNVGGGYRLCDEEMEVSIAPRIEPIPMRQAA